MERSPDSQKILRRIFSKADCLECGICCTNPETGRFVLPVIDDDPLRETIRALAAIRGAEIEQVTEKGFNLIGRPKCHFLKDEGIKKPCGIYEQRPLVCATFPFIVPPVEARYADGTAQMLFTLMLTSACPPLKKAKEEGVTYVAFDEIVKQVVIDNRRALRGMMNVLGNALLNVIRYSAVTPMLSPENVIEVEGRGILPIS